MWNKQRRPITFGTKIPNVWYSTVYASQQSSGGSPIYWNFYVMMNVDNEVFTIIKTDKKSVICTSSKITGTILQANKITG